MYMAYTFKTFNLVFKTTVQTSFFFAVFAFLVRLHHVSEAFAECCFCVFVSAVSYRFRFKQRFRFNGPLRQFFSLYRAVSQREGERGWLVCCFGLNGPLRQYLSLYRAVYQREREKEKRNDRRE